jgi:transcription initiation factor IIE alpha subunit
MGKGKPADPNLVHRIATGYMGTCVLLAALELNIFDALTEKSMTAQEMADALGFDPKPVERLMVALTALKLLDRKDGEYTLGPEAQRYLVKSSPPLPDAGFYPSGRAHQGKPGHYGG